MDNMLYRTDEVYYLDSGSDVVPMPSVRPNLIPKLLAGSKVYLAAPGKGFTHFIDFNYGGPFPMLDNAQVLVPLFDSFDIEAANRYYGNEQSGGGISYFTYPGDLKAQEWYTCGIRPHGIIKVLEAKGMKTSELTMGKLRRLPERELKPMQLRFVRWCLTPEVEGDLLKALKHERYLPLEEEMVKGVTLNRTKGNPFQLGLQCEKRRFTFLDGFECMTGLVEKRLSKRQDAER